MFIAEVGLNHNGSLDIAKQLIRAAKDSGVDVVKFQKRNPDKCVPENQKNILKDTPWGKITYLEYKKIIEFGKEEYDEIDRYCNEIGIEWTASVWDLDSLDFIMQYNVPFIKIPSALITDIELLNETKNTFKPVIISTGMSTLSEVADAVKILNNRDLTIMHCNSSYPTPNDEINLAAIQTLKRLFPKHIIGYSGHETGTYPTLLAVFLGAMAIERHITLDKNMWGSDQKASLNIKELTELIQVLNNMPLWIGNGSISVTQSEIIVKNKLRK